MSYLYYEQLIIRIFAQDGLFLNLTRQIHDFRSRWITFNLDTRAGAERYTSQFLAFLFRMGHYLFFEFLRMQNSGEGVEMIMTTMRMTTSTNNGLQNIKKKEDPPKTKILPFVKQFVS